MVREILLLVVGLYLLIGVLVALWFVIVGAARRDHAAKDTPLRVRLIFAPGAVALWPVLLMSAKPNIERDPVGNIRALHARRHLLMWSVLAPLLLVGVVALLAARPSAPTPAATDAHGAEVSE